ncbi:MAG: glycerate kinase [Pseudomonadota bacterium]|nr:glycerate kinase [Pseudomonadota bacterium]
MSRFSDARARELLLAVFRAAVKSADPFAVLPAHLPQKPRGRCIVVGAGKASARMAAALEAAWPDVALTGVVTTRYHHAVPTARIEVIEAGHPVPDANSERAARRILETVSGLTASDLVIMLASGGGSATMALGIDGITLADKANVTRQLLACGATIHEINAMRRFLSAVKGGRLAAAAAPARILTLVISDIPGDDPAEVASGPTIGVPPDAECVREIAKRYRLDLPASVAAYMAREAPLHAAVHGEVHVIATAMTALRAASECASGFGLAPMILGDAIEDESKDLGIVMAGIARSCIRHGLPAAPPALLLSGGETTVTLPRGGGGRGGRNQEFLLSLALALQGQSEIWALACDSDGIDGTEDAAGAIIAPDTLQRAAKAKIDLADLLARHASYDGFAALGDLIVTGPTFTNVNDIRAVLIG